MITTDEMRQETNSDEADQKRYACRDCGIPFETDPDICTNCGSTNITNLTEILNPDFRD